MSEPARLLIVLELSPSIRAGLGPGEAWLGSELTGALQRIVDDLGIPAEPHVELVTFADAGMFRLRVGRDLLPCARMLVDDVARDLGMPDDFRKHIDDPSSMTIAADTLRTLLVQVCSTSVAAQAERLITQDVVTAWRARTTAAAAIDAYQLAGILRALLASGISVDDAETITRRVAADRAAGRSQRTTIEALIALFRPLAIDLEIAADAAAGVLEGIGTELQAIQQSHVVHDSVELLQMMRDTMFWELGIRVPPVRAALAPLPAGTFACRINHRRGRVWRALRPGERLISGSPEWLRERGIAALRPGRDPANRQECAVIAAADAEQAATAGLATWTPLAYMLLCVAAEIRGNAHAFIDIDEVEASVSELEPYFPGIAGEVTADGMLEHTTAVLRELLADEVSVRDARRIIDAVLTTDHVYADSNAIVFDDRVQLFTDTRAELLGKVTIAAAQARKRLNRYLTHKYTRGQNTLVVLLLDPTSIEQPVARCLAGTDPLERDWLERLSTAIEAECGSAGAGVALLTTAPVAMYLRRALRHACPGTPVLAYDELAPDVNIQPLARVDLAALPALV